MTTPEEVNRLYNKEDNKMLEEATVKQANATEDIVKISEIDNKIDLPFITACGVRLSAAKAFLTDTAVRAGLVTLTENVESLMTQCRNGYAEVKHFVVKAFPNSAGIQKEFGFKTFKNARKSQPKMIVFMDQLVITLGKYETELTNVGMPATLPVRITDLAKNLTTADKLQEDGKSDRSVSTQDRVISYNSVWKDLQLICSAGKLAFLDDYARYKRYILYAHDQQPPKTPEEFDVLPAGQTATALTEFTTVTPIVFFNAGKTDLKFFRHTVENEPNGDLGFVLTAGANVVKDLHDIPGIGDFINVTNLSATDEGLYSVMMAE
jgi:hypothetical protein